MRNNLSNVRILLVYRHKTIIIHTYRNREVPPRLIREGPHFFALLKRTIEGFEVQAQPKLVGEEVFCEAPPSLRIGSVAGQKSHVLRLYPSKSQRRQLLHQSKTGPSYKVSS